MSSMLEKIGEKLHIGGQKKPEDEANKLKTHESGAADAHHTPPASHGAPAGEHYSAPYSATQVDHHTTAPPVVTEPDHKAGVGEKKHEGIIDKIKKKKERKERKEGDGSSSSSSDSD